MMRRERGRWGEDRAVQWLEERGFSIEVRNWRPPTGSGAGEVDIVASREGPHSELWLFEVKCHASFGNGAFQPLISPRQIKRQNLARAYWVRSRAYCRLRTGLLWVNPDDGRVQFLENPCYS